MTSTLLLLLALPFLMAALIALHGRLSRTTGAWLAGAAPLLGLALRCDNCLDKSATTASLYGYSYLNPPRTLMLSARRRF